MKAPRHGMFAMPPEDFALSIVSIYLTAADEPRISSESFASRAVFSH